MNITFPQDPSITLYDPLAKFLGVGDGHFTYCFEDVVKLSGHACPTVAGAYLMAIHALKALYGDETPERGDIGVTIYSAPDEGVTGPISQIFTHITGATAMNGFHGLGGNFVRSGLMQFLPGTDGPAPFVFERRSTGDEIGVDYNPSSIGGDSSMMGNLQLLMQGSSDPNVQEAFSSAWRNRVMAILEDKGNSTVSTVTID